MKLKAVKHYKDDGTLDYIDLVPTDNPSKEEIERVEKAIKQVMWDAKNNLIGDAANHV